MAHGRVSQPWLLRARATEISESPPHNLSGSQSDQTHAGISFFWYLLRGSNVPTCAHCLLCCHPALLRRAWLHHLQPPMGPGTDKFPCVGNLNSLLQFEQSQLTLTLPLHPVHLPIDHFGVPVLDFPLKVHILYWEPQTGHIASIVLSHEVLLNCSPVH